MPGEWSEHLLHGDAVTQLRLSADGRRLISAGRDGSLCIWKVAEAEAAAAVAEMVKGTTVLRETE